jgi:Protein of unknown function (DUF3034)
MNTRTRSMSSLSIALAMFAIGWSSASAGERVLATGGVSPVEGGGGGGLSPWAVIAGSGSRGQNGTTAQLTRMRTKGGFDLTVKGVAVGINDRVEMSMAQWSFKLSDTVPGVTIHQSMVGVKVRLAGHALYDQDTWMPQLAAGVQFKQNDDYAVPRALGSLNSSGVDVYFSATKIWLSAVAGYNALANVTVRASRANQFGLLGFGGDLKSGYSVLPEVSLGVMPKDNMVIGLEWRAKPDNLSVFKEEDAKDIFLAWFPNRHLSFTAAWVDMGNIADKPKQSAWYLSTQASF